MQPRTHRMNRAAIGLLIFAALVIGLGIWAQVQQSAFAVARADAVAAQGAAGLNIVPIPLILKPFEGGLVPAFLLDPAGQGTPFGIMAKIGGAIGLLGLLLLPLRQRILPAVPDDIEDLSIEPAIAPSMPQVSAKSDWQFRLAQKMSAQSAPPQKTYKPAGGFGRSLYRVALFLVGIAFIVLAAVLLLGSSGDAGAVDFAAVADTAMLTGRQAMEGDRDAMIAMAQIAAVSVGLLIVLKVLFTRRKPVKRRNNFAV